MLHAIKAVSDEKQRGDNKPAAMEHAAQVAIGYLGFLFKKNLLLGSPIVQYNNNQGGGQNDQRTAKPSE